jgi:CTP:phosphocholine cytidylyltransferase-like protein
MNERIRQLAIEAGYEKDMFGIGHWDMPECKKFAELIISECAALAKSKSEHIEGIKTEDHDDQMQIQSLGWQFKEFGYEIKKHFGVEG